MKDKKLRELLDEMGLIKDFGFCVEESLENKISRRRLGAQVMHEDRMKRVVEGICDYLGIEPDEPEWESPQW